MRLSGLMVCLWLVAITAVPAQTNELAQKSQQAHELMAAGKFEQAISLYRELLQAAPKNPGLQMDLGMALHPAGRDREAIPPLQVALQQQPDSFPANLFLGLAYLGVGAPAKAILPLTRASKLQPANPDPQQALAGAFMSLDRLAKAGEHYRKLSELVPQAPGAWAGLGQCYEALAQAEFEKLGRVAKDSGYWYALMAEARVKSQQYKSAFYLGRRALELAPHLRGVHTELAEIYRQSGHADWAATEEEKERNLPAPDCAARPAECAFFAGHFAEAAAAAGSRDTPEALYWRTKAFNALANNAFARLEQLPPSVESCEQAAMFRRSQRRFGEEAQAWREALKLAPDDPEIQTQLAFALNQVGDYPAAQTILRPLRESHPESAIINYLLGDTLFKLQQPAQAIPYLEKAVTRDPRLLTAQSSLARAYVQTGESAKAIPHLQAALPSDEDGSLHYQLARAYTANGQPQLGQEILRKYQEIQNTKAAEREGVEKEVPITAPNN